MANEEIKLLEFSPIGSFALGDKTMYFEDAPGGMSYSMDHLNPVNARRTQNGTLITQTIRYEKKSINLTISFYDSRIRTYFKSLYASGFRLTFVIWTENPVTYAEETEFNGIVQILNLNEDNDQTGNIRTLNMILAEA
jgi:hypothetical protein